MPADRGRATVAPMNFFAPDNRSCLLVVMLCLVSAAFSGCSKRQPAADVKRTDSALDPDRTPATSDSLQPTIQAWESIVDLEKKIAVFETVFWEPRDTISMRKLIRETELVKGKKVLEIGTGTGLISLCCLSAGADSVVATDINPSAVANAAYNAERFEWKSRLDCRRVSEDSPSAYAVIGGNEKFDIIFSNPPWEDDLPKTVNEYALYDPGFRLIDSMMKGLKQHLTPGGKAYLAYGCVSAIREIQKLGTACDLEVKILDDRKLEELDEVFLPGMMLEITPR